MTVDLRDFRLIYLAPRTEVGAVGYYADNFVAAIRSHFGDVVEHRHGGPGDDGVSDLRRERTVVRELIRSGPPGRVLVHTELSGGAVVPFWAIPGLGDVPVTATVHDPPQLVWWPARTRFMARHRLVNHGLHFPLRRISRSVQRTVAGDRTFFVLSEIGRRSLEREYPKARAVHVPHLVFDKPIIRPTSERPRAVGFFGMVYRGKGFEHVLRMREYLPDDIVIRIAGRGTEDLPRRRGFDIVGGVDDSAEVAFFESVRAIVVPYGRRTFYGNAYPWSGAVAHATAYRTPVVCSDHGALGELTSEAGALVVHAADEQPGGLARAFATAVAGLLRDDDRLAELSRNIDKVRQTQLAPRVAEAFAATWSDVLYGFARRR